MTVLITGATGFLGPHLMAAFRKSYAEVCGVSRSGGSDYQYDLTDPTAVSHLMEMVKPSLVVHAAAMTDVTRCEQNPPLAFKVNTGMTANIVKALPYECRLVNISTDMVYSGIGPHAEHSRSENPVNVYGLSKFMGEFEAAKANNYLNIRTNIFGFSTVNKPSSLADFLVDRLKSGEPFQTYTDSFFSPLWVETLSTILAVLARKKNTGTYNVGSVGGMSKSKFAAILASELGLSAKGMRPVESASITGRVIRPLDTRLDLVKAERVFGFAFPSLEMEITAACESRQWIN